MERSSLDAVFVVLARDDALYAERIGEIQGVVPLYCGGATRAESVRERPGRDRSARAGRGLDHRP